MAGKVRVGLVLSLAWAGLFRERVVRVSLLRERKAALVNPETHLATSR
jgi:hypothetical protein